MKWLKCDSSILKATNLVKQFVTEGARSDSIERCREECSGCQIQFLAHEEQ